MNITSLIILLLVSTITRTGLAQPADQNRSHLRSLIDQLGSDSWIDRDHASNELSLVNPDIRLDDLELFLSDMTLTIEQRTRLEHACMFRFLAYPKGGLGVSFGTSRIGAIEIQPIGKDPRFPASAMLNPGDAIALVGSDLIESQAELRAHILSRSPGETLPVTLIRADKLIKMDLPLGSLTDLSGAARYEPNLAWRALELRWERKGIQRHRADRAGVLIDTSDWQSAAFPVEHQPDPQSPTHRYTRALVLNPMQIIHIGRLTLPQRTRIWESREQFLSYIQSIQTIMDGYVLERTNAQRSLLTQQISMLEDKLNNATQVEDKKNIESEMRILKSELDELQLQTTNPLPDPVQAPIQSP
ncbi:MAG: hypothetical protein P1U42_05145 [Phycisphaerales bacterium]|nr:hypothetical protein [Phycisphaerales bacterium]